MVREIFGIGSGFLTLIFWFGEQLPKGKSTGNAPGSKQNRAKAGCPTSRFQDVANLEPEPSHKLQVTGYRQPAAGYKLAKNPVPAIHSMSILLC